MPFGTASGATEAILILVAAGAVLAGLLFCVWRAVTADAGAFPEADTDLPAENAEALTHHYYRFDDDFFRAKAGEKSVSDVLRNGRWIRYTGDPLEPIVLGKPVKPREIPGRAGEIAELLETRKKVERQIEILRTMRLRTDRRDTAVVTAELKNILAGIDQRLSELQPGTDGLSPTNIQIG